MKITRTSDRFISNNKCESNKRDRKLEYRLQMTNGPIS